jgi:CubicO group peptidase (beta-lactamase class C family)
MKVINVRAQRTLYFVFAFMLLAVSIANSAFAQTQDRDYWPTSGWKISTPEMQGMDSEKLSVADEFIQERLPDAFSLLVVRNGYLVFEKYYSWGSPDKYAVVHSVTKSVTSALIGIALNKGYLNSVDQKLIEFFPEEITDDLDSRKKQITLRHLLTMSTGLRWNDRGPVMRAWYTSPNWAKFTIQLPQEKNPGDVFNYNSSASHLLSIILSKSTKTSTLDFARQNLFEPLGIRSAYWHQDPQGYHIGGFGLGLSARDMAKIGFLYLNKGYWNGQSIVPEYWVQESASQQIRAFRHPIYGSFGYGYQWWVKKVDGCDGYRAWGRRGQFIVVVPDLDLVVAVTSETAQPHPPTSIHYSPLFDLVAAAVERNRPPKEPLKSLALPPDVKSFIAEFNQAIINNDAVTMAELFSDRFLHDGGTKQSALKLLMESLSYASEAEIILTKFELDGDIARVEGIIKDKYFEVPLAPGGMLIKEDGRWKWYGNQLSK